MRNAVECQMFVDLVGHHHQVVPDGELRDVCQFVT